MNSVENKGLCLSIEDAKNESLKNFDREKNPNGVYAVCRYFDDVYEFTEKTGLTKKLARSLAKKLNLNSGCYTSYDIQVVR